MARVWEIEKCLAPFVVQVGDSLNNDLFGRLVGNIKREDSIVSLSFL